MLHGDIPQKQREITFEGFRKGQFMCLIATNVAARGIDIPETDLIIQLSPPKDNDTYVHSAGRTARAERSGMCITFYNQSRFYRFRELERETNIKFEKHGIPSAADVVKAQAESISMNISKVNPSVLKYYEETSDKLLKDHTPKEALSRAFALLCGQTDEFAQRSLITGQQDLVTYKLANKDPIFSTKFIFLILKKEFQEEIVNGIKNLRLCADELEAIFDVAKEQSFLFDKFIDVSKENLGKEDEEG